MDRNLVNELDIYPLGGNAGAGDSFDIVAAGQEAVLGAGGIVVGIALNSAFTTPVSYPIKLQESDDDSAWNDVDPRDMTWKPMDAPRAKGQWEDSTNPIGLGALFYNAENIDRYVVLAQYNGNKRYIRLSADNTPKITGTFNAVSNASAAGQLSATTTAITIYPAAGHLSIIESVMPGTFLSTFQGGNDVLSGQVTAISRSGELYIYTIDNTNPSALIGGSGASLILDRFTLTSANIDSRFAIVRRKVRGDAEAR